MVDGKNAHGKAPRYLAALSVRYACDAGENLCNYSTLMQCFRLFFFAYIKESMRPVRF